ncbi:MAG TPA: CDP-glycerol glycerophosphotransferase family protein [Propionibacteriaceae bacterium]
MNYIQSPVKVVYNAFNGRYADNPRAIYESLLARDLDVEHVWLADPDQLAGFPGDVKTVQIASPDAVAALESADLHVSNCHTNLDSWRKLPGARYLQTWHGTPLKRIHRSAVFQPGDDIMADLDTDIARWDYLITPSRAGTQLLRSAFGYSGPVLETGYPRNDALQAPDAGQRRARLRRELGISDDTTVVLYAPTYRDDDVAVPDAPLGLDLPALTEQLGGHFVVLLRLHYYLKHRPSWPAAGQVRDLSTYPDVTDLYLAADVLVTDYSSALFDFAVTGKPIVLYAYDLEHYRDRLRGFTFDLQAEAPGPVLTDQASLTAALLDLPGTERAYADRYAAFRERYCHLEDGHATDRVIEHLWPSAVSDAGPRVRGGTAATDA